MMSPVGVANLSWLILFCGFEGHIRLTERRRFYVIWMVITLAWIPMVWAVVPEIVRQHLLNLNENTNFIGGLVVA